MRSRDWIRQQRLADAQRLREQIAQLETDLVAERGASKRRRLIETGFHIHSCKSRLERLERCIAALQSTQSALGRPPAIGPSSAREKVAWAVRGQHDPAAELGCQAFCGIRKSLPCK